MGRKLIINSLNAILLIMIALMFSEVRCGNYGHASDSKGEPQKTADRQLADAFAAAGERMPFAFLYPDAGDDITPREVLCRIRDIWNGFVRENGGRYASREGQRASKEI